MDRQQMIEQLEKYKLANGYHDIKAIIRDENPEADGISITFAMFFGGMDDDAPEDSPLVALARELDEELMQAQEQEQAHEQEQQAETIIAKSEAGERLTNEEMEILVSAGYAYEVYDDPDSNRPTGIVIGKAGSGNQYTDQAGLEERAGEVRL